MPDFTVKYGDTTRVLEAPEGTTQEQAQQIADLHRDFSGETGRQGLTNPLTGKPTGILGGDFGAAVGEKASNFVQGGAELVGGPLQLMGATPGPLYQQAEAEPTDTGDKIARFAGAVLPLAPLGAAKTLVKSPSTVGRGAAGRFMRIPGVNPLPGAALIPPAVGAIEGASTPADSQSQRWVNAGLGAVAGKVGSMSPQTASALDHLVGTLVGGLLGHGAGGGLSGLASMWGARLGNQMSHYAPVVSYARQLLSRFPPAVVARILTDAGYPVTKILGQEYNYMQGTPDGGERPSQDQ